MLSPKNSGRSTPAGEDYHGAMTTPSKQANLLTTPSTLKSLTAEQLGFTVRSSAADASLMSVDLLANPKHGKPGQSLEPQPLALKKRASTRRTRDTSTTSSLHTNQSRRRKSPELLRSSK